MSLSDERIADCMVDGGTTIASTPYPWPYDGDLRADNTVLIFSSDNGGVGGYDREGIKKEKSITDNAPLRSGKGSLYEGGTRVPFIVRWPGVVKPGTVCDVPTVHVDIYPTFLEIGGGRRPAHTLDGESVTTFVSQ